MVPAIKNTYLKLLFSIFLLPALFSCDQKKEEVSAVHQNSNEITFISVSNIGGDQGDYKIIKVTQDSIHAEKELRPAELISNGTQQLVYPSGNS